MSPADISTNSPTTAPTPSPTPSLEQSLAQLQTQLAAASSVDEHTRGLLRPLLADIERLLKERAASTDGALAPHRLEGMAVEFETDHPSLAANLREFIDLLGRAGL